MLVAVPPTSLLSRRHVVPPLGGRGDTVGYLMRVVSAENNNSVSHFDGTLNAMTGRSKQLRFWTFDQWIKSKFSENEEQNQSPPCQVLRLPRG